jgi:hypothetical protein
MYIFWKLQPLHNRFTVISTCISSKVNCEWRKRKHLKIRGCHVYHLLLSSKFPNSFHTVYLWFLRLPAKRTVRHTCLTPLGQILSFRSQGNPCYFFVLDKVVPGQVFLRVLAFSPVNTIPLMRLTQLHFNIILIRITSGRILGTLKAIPFQILESTG